MFWITNRRLKELEERHQREIDHARELVRLQHESFKSQLDILSEMHSKEMQHLKDDVNKMRLDIYQRVSDIRQAATLPSEASEAEMRRAEEQAAAYEQALRFARGEPLHEPRG